MPFGMWARVGPHNRVHIPPAEGAILEWGRGHPSAAAERQLVPRRWHLACGHVNQHEDYLMKTTSGLVLQRQCNLLSNYFDLLFWQAVVPVLCFQPPATVFNGSGPNLACGHLITSSWSRGSFCRETAWRPRALGMQLVGLQLSDCPFSSNPEAPKTSLQP